MTENAFAERRLTMTVLMTPDLVNFSGNVHGGAILRLLDQVAYACASRYCGVYVVTLSVDQVFFKQAIHVGELVTFLAQINYTGRTSMEVGIKVVTENTQTRQCRHAMSCFFTMVAVDDQRRPIAAPQFTPEPGEDERRFRAAIQRKDARKRLETQVCKTDENTGAIVKSV